MDIKFKNCTTIEHILAARLILDRYLTGSHELPEIGVHNHHVYVSHDMGFDFGYSVYRTKTALVMERLVKGIHYDATQTAKATGDVG